MKAQQTTFDWYEKPVKGIYKAQLSAQLNGKGVLDVDTVKGCRLGMLAYPNGGCYGECYALKNAVTYGFNFSKSVARLITSRKHFNEIALAVKEHPVSWYRIGTAGDPSHDWDHTIEVIARLHHCGKASVIITKHWVELSDKQLAKLSRLNVVINTSTSGMDTDNEIKQRVRQSERIKKADIKSVVRVVTCKYGQTEWGRYCNHKQQFLLSLGNVIDNPFRCRKNNPHVLCSDIVVETNCKSVGGGKTISMHNKSTYIGTCARCPDQCGVTKHR